MLYEPQIVDEFSNVILLNSPFYINCTSSNIFTHIRVKLWVWEGDLTQPYDDEVEPNVLLFKEKVNLSDTFIQFELSDYVKDLFEPKFQYSNTGLPTITQSQVFFKAEYDICTTSTHLVDGVLTTTIVVSEVISTPTYMGTEGWLWDYESVNNSLNSGNGSFGFFNAINPIRYYDPRIRYTNYNYDLTQSISTYLSIRTPYPPPTNLQVCPKEPWLIVYINKEGQFDYFTPTGKSIINEEIKREKYTKTINNPLTFVNSRDHRIKQYNSEVKTEITLNTGILPEGSGQIIEEIIYSPVVYLIEFKKTLNKFGYYNNWITHPVIVTQSDFTKKTRLNDKGKISYNIKFETTTNKISNIR